MTKTAVATMEPKPKPMVRLYQLSWTSTTVSGCRQSITHNTKFFLENPRWEWSKLQRQSLGWSESPEISDVKVTFIEIDPEMYLWSGWNPLP